MRYPVVCKIPRCITNAYEVTMMKTLKKQSKEKHRKMENRNKIMYACMKSSKHPCSCS